jgi:hypothetical protein
MLETRFLFLEGIMGSGKTTAAWTIAETLQRQGIAARFLAEGPTLDEPAHPLRVATALPHPNAVWLDISPEAYIERSLALWRTFLEEARSSTTITVCDGLLFHGNMTDLLLLNAAPEVLRDYITRLLAQIEELRPALIYLYPADLATALRGICERRGPAWEAYQVNWKVGSLYGVARGLSGFAGLLSLYQDYRTLCDDIFAHLTLPKLAIRNDGDWTAIYKAISAFLSIDVPPPDLP